MTDPAFRRIGELVAAGRPFVVATVVWARGPSSGKAGATAVIEPDGTVTGWIGGACAEPTVLRQAREVFETGSARLLRLGPADELDDDAREGVVTAPFACASEGTLEVFLEAVLPAPRLVVVGRSPAVAALARAAASFGWRPVVVDDGGEAARWPDDVEVRTDLAALAELGLDGSCAVVVATQGHYDEPALEAALATDAGYVGLVASRRRAAAVVGYLRDRGLADADLARVAAPAGLDLGSLPHRDLGLSILAELAVLRARGRLHAPPRGPGVSEVESIDPVCGMTVTEARFTVVHEDRTYVFCCPACARAFEEDPAGYVVEEETAWS